jgi:hypothetical protein
VEQTTSGAHLAKYGRGIRFDHSKTDGPHPQHSYFSNALTRTAIRRGRFERGTLLNLEEPLGAPTAQVETLKRRLTLQWEDQDES